jgi:hypothetical protein
VLGRRGKILGKKSGGKKKYACREDGIFIHPKNGLNELIRNWCIGGCWFTPANVLSSIFTWDPAPTHNIESLSTVVS